MREERKLPLRPALEKIQVYQPGKPVEEVERELGIKAIKLASNENPLGPSPGVLAAIRRAARQVHIYPDGGCYRLRQALAKYLRCSPEELILGNGSNELLLLLGQAILEPGDQVLTSEMSFVVYNTVPQLMDAQLTRVAMQKYTYDLAAMARAITPKTRLIFIANPNNPTGTIVEPGLLESFINQVPGNCLVVLDEAYFEYADPGKMADTLSWVRNRDNLVVLRTFSKAFGLAGLRVGYGLAPRILREAIDKVRAPFNVNGLAQVAAVAALQDLAHMRKVVRLARSERKRVGQALAAMGYTFIPSQANFLWVQLSNADSESGTGQNFCQALMRLGVIVRPFPGPYVRITLGTKFENDKLLQAMKKLRK